MYGLTYNTIRINYTASEEKPFGALYHFLLRWAKTYYAIVMVLLIRRWLEGSLKRVVTASDFIADNLTQEKTQSFKALATFEKNITGFI